MSVINQMLKDLDKRTGEQPKFNLPNFGYHKLASNKHRSQKWLAIAMLLVAGGLLVADLYVVGQHINNIFEKSKIKPLPIKTKSAVYYSEIKQQPFAQSLLANIKPAELTEMFVKNQIESTTFELNFSNSVLYRIIQNNQSGVITLTFENANLLQKLPLINYSQSSIANLKILSQTNNQLTLLIYPKSGVNLEQAGFDLSNPKLFTIKFSAPTIPLVEKLSVPILDPAVSLKSNVLPKKPIILPINAGDIYQQAVKLWQEQKQTDAELLIKDNLKKFPQEISLILLKARIELDEGKVRSAIQSLEKHSPEIIDHPEYYSLLAALYQRNNQAALSAKLYQQLIAIEPGNAIWWLGLAVSLDSLGKHLTAMHAYQQADQSNGLTPTLKAFVETKIYPY